MTVQPRSRAMPSIPEHELEDMEVELVLEAMFRRYGYDFRDYARPSVRRRLRQVLATEGLASVGELIPRLLHDPAFFARMLTGLSVTVTEMFRDPGFFLAFRAEVVPHLRTFPYIKIWHAGCSTGEEVYSMAILLREEGLLERATIYATDLSHEALETARTGIYPLERIREYTRNYHLAGGSGSFADYYLAEYDAAIFDSALRRNVVFSRHNLAVDGVFSEMHCIICRNVLIYFTQPLKERALALFGDSLLRGGILALGSKESLKFSQAAGDYTSMDQTWRIYRKTT